MEKILLNVLGITYSQVQQGAYALLLEQDGGPYRIPVVVGTAEAQAIAVKLESVVPPRPLPHDLMVTMSHAFGIRLDEVFIYKFEDGVFLSELSLSGQSRQITLDSRTSDAIALALRTGAPIYTTPEVMEQTGFVFTPDEEPRRKAPRPRRSSKKKSGDLESLSIEQLEDMLARCVEQEEYEKAAVIKAAIQDKRDSRQSGDQD